MTVAPATSPDLHLATSTRDLPDATDVAEAARERATRTMFGLSTLFSERPELRGVHAPADLAEDAIRWSA